MHESTLKQIKELLARDFKFEKLVDGWWRHGTCPTCGKQSIFTRADNPWLLKCERTNKCGEEFKIKELYPHIFENWSERFPQTQKNPNAAADQYLIEERGFKIDDIKTWYSQEVYKDSKTGLTSATVRFIMPNGGYWERIIDTPKRFDRKAHFSFGCDYQGSWWKPKDLTIEKLANAEEIWITEGIFNALALREAGKIAVSAMSSNNYPSKDLAALRKFIADKELRHSPTIVFAFDNGKAGEKATLKYIDWAQKEGWLCRAALPVSEGIYRELDWNDHLISGKLKEENFAEYLWNGDVLLSDSAAEKAFLIYQNRKWNNFHFTFENQTYWGSFDSKKFTKATQDGLHENKAIKTSLEIENIANCKFRFLYFERNEVIDESYYYLAVTNTQGIVQRARFSGGAISSGTSFKERLLGVSAGAQYTGTTKHLEHIVKLGTPFIKTVYSLDFTGYSLEHKAYVYGKLAVKDGNVFKINDEDYFELGKYNLKLASKSEITKNEYNPEKLDTSWLDPFIKAYGNKGLVCLTYFVVSCFAEQIRFGLPSVGFKGQSSLGFLEITGEPGGGKSSILTFLWKLFGRLNYEGFDPTGAKATAAAIARNLSQVANMPVVMIEGDRTAGANHNKKFEWGELKTYYNGGITRARGVRNGGNDTYEPRFRAALIIAQNAPVDAEPAVLERIMAVEFNKKGRTQYTKIAASEIDDWDIDNVSGTLIHIVRREKSWVENYVKVFKHWEDKFLRNEVVVKNQRIRLNHAQMHAAVDATFNSEKPLFSIGQNQIQSLHDFIDEMAIKRDKALELDHPIILKFWEVYEYLCNIHKTVSGDETLADEYQQPINLSRNSDQIAINLNRFVDLAKKHNQEIDSIDTLKKHLAQSKSRPFIAVKNVCSPSGRTYHCWVFKNPTNLNEKG